MNQSNYMRVMTFDKNESEADIYLYGFIGQSGFYEDEEDDDDITDITVVRAIKELERTKRRINIRINSPGGSVLHGDPIIAAMRQSTAEIHTYNDGMAASMAADIWLAGKVRHMSTHSKLMIHATSGLAFGTANDMLDAAAMLEKFDQTSIASMALATGMDEDEIKRQFYDYKDHWLTARDAMQMGMITEIEDYASNSPIANPEKMNFRQLLAYAHKVDFPTDHKNTTNATNSQAVPETVATDATVSQRVQYLQMRDILLTQNH